MESALTAMRRLKALGVRLQSIISGRLYSLASAPLSVRQAENRKKFRRSLEQATERAAIVHAIVGLGAVGIRCGRGVERAEQHCPARSGRH